MGLAEPLDPRSFPVPFSVLMPVYRADTPERIRYALRTLVEGPGLLKLDRTDRSDFLRYFYRRYEDAPVEQIERDAREMFGQMIMTKSFPDGMRRVRQHRALGHRTILITGALSFNVEGLRPLFDEIFAVNVKGYLLTVEATWRELVKTRGSIVMTLSNASFYADGGGPVYTASKFADRGLMLQFAHELAPKVRVNGVAVGGMQTDLRGPKAIGLDSRSFSDTIGRRSGTANPYIPLHDISTDPAGFTGPYVMLASPADAGAVTGAIINADGGIAARGFRNSAGGDDL